MGITLGNAKSRRERGPFVPIPLNVLTHDNFINLELAAQKVLFGLFEQVRFGKDGGTKNNGDLCATWSMMRHRIGSQQTLQLGLKELLHYGFIILTRQGEALRSDKPNLYAITWWAIDGCDGKLDITATNAPLNYWREIKPKYRKPKRARAKNGKSNN